ncbi:MAG: hypothetical protein ABIH28_02515 [archaeon]
MSNLINFPTERRVEQIKAERDRNFSGKCVLCWEPRPEDYIDCVGPVHYKCHKEALEEYGGRKYDF